MEKEFWLERWARNETGFHEGEVNAYLQQYWPRMQAAQGTKVFVPLCGKAVDMRWLRDQGHSVVGVELSRIAVEAFFREQGLAAHQQALGKFRLFEADDINILCGDFFDLTREQLAGVTLVYDRASMVALPPSMRGKYAAHLLGLLQGGARILLIAFDYAQDEMPGPPFALSPQEIHALYGRYADIELLAEIDALPQNPRFASRGVSRLHERIYLLTRR